MIYRLKNIIFLNIAKSFFQLGRMGLSKFKKRRFFVILFLILILNINIIRVLGKSNPNFPDNFSSITEIEYNIEQKMIHWNEGQFEGDGSLNISFDHSVQNKLYLEGNYNYSIWQKACASSTKIKDRIYVEIDPKTRFIQGNSDQFVNLSLNNLYVHWFSPKDSFGPSTNNSYFLEALLIIHGLRINTSFDYIGEKILFVQNVRTECILYEWVGQIFYAGGYVCGLGPNPLLNCSIKYYYEKNTGILCYSVSNILEYLGDDPDIYQNHEITYSLTSINGNFGDQNTTNNEDGGGNNFWPWEGENGGDIVAYSIIGSIIAFGFVSIFIINKISKKRNLKALIEYEKRHGSVENINEDESS